MVQVIHSTREPNPGISHVFNDILYTRRLVLRKIRKEDLPLIHIWSNDPDAYGSYLTPEGFSLRQLQELFAMNTFWRVHDKTFLIEMRTQEKPLGTVHYWLKPDPMKTAVLSIKIADPCERDKGFGTEAQKYLVIYLFEQIGVRRVHVYTDTENKAQQRCLKKLGFSIHRSLLYDDRQVMRSGYEFELNIDDFLKTAIYRFHYE
jgi:RimJ/RimL family protein N-acetyltransferase